MGIVSKILIEHLYPIKKVDEDIFSSTLLLLLPTREFFID
ncbi:hypothetical protein HMPREF3200_01647 [Anaerococcus tetradius]|uniref:Uncharacterized protein n=1 Tax=Anaerococcus tetradius TaxID=33036 RepID=A0A133KB15_9FIRM|nr:hypothetical protein HMPREF3200_01647 [Anaerococcus tetradius]